MASVGVGRVRDFFLFWALMDRSSLVQKHWVQDDQQAATVKPLFCAVLCCNSGFATSNRQKGGSDATFPIPVILLIDICNCI
jgi:hypothetical protein